MIVGIVGSRNYRPVAIIQRVLDRFEELYPGLTILSGGEPTGVDDAVEKECVARGYHMCLNDETGLEHLRKPMPYCFAAFPPANGSARAKFARNSKIVQHSLAIVALYGPGKRTPGTTDTVTKAQRRGLPVYINHEGHWESSWDTPTERDK